MIDFVPLHSTANPRVKEVRALLRDRRTSLGANVFAGEGMQLATRVLGSSFLTHFLMMSEDVAAELPSDLSQRISEKKTPCFSLPATLFQKVSRRNMSSGIIFVAEPKEWDLNDLPDDNPVLVLDRTSNPRNIGAIARTCEAAGLGGLILIGTHADPYSYESVRASMGSIVALPVIALGQDELVRWSRESGRTLIGTSGAANESVWDLRIPHHSLLLFGNEGEGLPPSLQGACDHLVKIPYNTTVDSLNLGSAAAIVCFEYRRQSQI